MGNILLKAAYLVIALLVAGCAPNIYEGYNKYFLHGKSGRVVLTSPVPVDQTYSELSVKHRDIVKAFYDDLSAGDSPPYPKQGVKPLYLGFIELQQGRPSISTIAKRNVSTNVSEGNMDVLATISERGKVKNVQIVESPGRRGRKSYLESAVSELLHQTEFQPAICNKKSCESVYRFQIYTDVFHSRGEASFYIYPPAD